MLYHDFYETQNFTSIAIWAEWFIWKFSCNKFLFLFLKQWYRNANRCFQKRLMVVILCKELAEKAEISKILTSSELSSWRTSTHARTEINSIFHLSALLWLRTLEPFHWSRLWVFTRTPNRRGMKVTKIGCFCLNSENYRFQDHLLHRIVGFCIVFGFSMHFARNDQSYRVRWKME